MFYGIYGKYCKEFSIHPGQKDDEFYSYIIRKKFLETYQNYIWK